MIPHQVSLSQEPRLIPTEKPRLLMVSDSAEALIRLRAALNIGEVEITGVTALQGLSRACRVPHDLAVIAPGPDQLIEALRRLRGNKATSLGTGRRRARRVKRGRAYEGD